MYTHHKFEHEFEPGTALRTSYVVCALPRSGSSLLCELLCNTGHAGAPTEFLDEETMEGFCSAWKTVHRDDYLDALLAKKTSPNGVFGIKLHYEQWQDHADCALLEMLPGPRFVYTDRRDRLRQAISFARALQTGQWASDHPAGEEPAVFDTGQVRDSLRRIERIARGWEGFFDRRGITPLRLWYEDLAAAPQRVLSSVLEFLGVPVPSEALGVAPTLSRQADAITEEWVARMRRDDRLESDEDASR